MAGSSCEENSDGKGEVSKGSDGWDPNQRKTMLSSSDTRVII